jgi:hypothetical protein
MLLRGWNVCKAILNIHKIESSKDKPLKQAVWLSIAVIYQMKEVYYLIGMNQLDTYHLVREERNKENC